jgi:hypothetical protein
MSMFDEFELNEDGSFDVELEAEVTAKEEEEASDVMESATPEGDEILIKEMAKVELIDESHSLLSETRMYSTSVIRLTHKQKVAKVQKQAAYVIARETDDPLYQKLAKLNGLRNKYKAAIEKKYQQKARSRVREMLSGRTVATGKDQPKTDPTASQR